MMISFIFFLYFWVQKLFSEWENSLLKKSEIPPFVRTVPFLCACIALLPVRGLWEFLHILIIILIQFKIFYLSIYLFPTCSKERHESICSPPPSHGWKVGQTGFFSLSKATSLGERRLWIQTSCKVDILSVTSFLWCRDWMNTYIRWNFYASSDISSI